MHEDRDEPPPVRGEGNAEPPGEDTGTASAREDSPPPAPKKKKTPAPRTEAVDEEPPKPSSPPCYLRDLKDW